MGSLCPSDEKQTSDPSKKAKGKGVKKVKVKKPRKRRTSTTTSNEDIRKVYKFTSKILGHGTFGTVRLANEIINPDRVVAVKTIQKNKIKQKKFNLLKRELTILKHNDHPNIVNFYETFQDQKYLHLVMEYCSGGQLLDRFINSEMEYIDEQYVSKIMAKIFSAVHYMHSKGICHRDIKPENFMFLDDTKDSEIKAIDFGLSRKFEPDQHKVLNSVVGTPLYVAPEVFIQQKYDQRCDNWSLGVLMYVLLSGNAPFLGHNRNSVFKKIAKVDYSFPVEEWGQVSDQAKDLISKLLVKDVDKRLTIEQAMEHPWITTNMDQYRMNMKIVSRISQFKYQSEFKKIAVKTLVETMKEKEINDLKEQFLLIDKDRSGMIKYEELHQAFLDLGIDINGEEWQELTKNLKVDDKMGINYTTFIAGTLDRRVFFTKERLWNCFKHFDVDNTNYITIPNLKEAMARDGRKVPQETLEKMLKEVDIKENDMIDFDEFLRLMNVEDEVDLFRTQTLRFQQSAFNFDNMSDASLMKSGKYNAQGGSQFMSQVNASEGISQVIKLEPEDEDESPEKAEVGQKLEEQEEQEEQETG